jgi:Arc/MetJ family transcription regulator
MGAVTHDRAPKALGRTGGRPDRWQLGTGGGKVPYMAREKVTITADREKLAEVTRVTGALSTSAAVDLALDELLRLDRIRRDVAAYRSTPPTSEELALGLATPANVDLADDTNWEDLYPDEPV